MGNEMSSLRFLSQRSSGNVPIAVFGDGNDTVGFEIHSFSTFERVRKYGEGEKIGKAYSVGISKAARTINICSVASKKGEMVKLNLQDVAS